MGDDDTISKIFSLARTERLLMNCRRSEEESFYPNACYVCRCFGEKANLQRCGNCKMISYCCRGHQAKDWRSHKEFCKALCQLKEERKVDNLYQNLKYEGFAIAMQEKAISPEELFIRMYTISGLLTPTERLKMHAIAGRRFIGSTLPKMQQILKRPLKRNEIEMLINPRLCAVCFESDHKLLTNCKKCPQSSFCKQHINDPSHEDDCFKFLSTFYSPQGRPQKSPPLLKDIIDQMKFPSQTKVEKLPISMTKFFEKYFSNVSFDTFSIEKRVEFNCYFSHKFSAPLTILLAVEKLGLNLDSMTVHIFGANLHEQVSHNWEIILHYLPQLKNLKLILIGPELLAGVSIKHECISCKENKKQLIFEIHIAVYHEYCKSKNYEKPDMIVGFNAYFDIYPFWKESAASFNKGQCPFLITAYNRFEGHKNKEMIDSEFPSAHCVCSDCNPFASMNRQRSNIVPEFSASNEFISIYEHLGTK